MTFIDLDICNLAATLPVLYSMTLTYFFKVKISTCTVNISKTVRASAKLQEMIFIDCNICYRMASLRMLYSDLDLGFSRSNISNVNISKTVRVSEKCSSMKFMQIDIFHRTGLIRMLYSLNFQGNTF